MKPSIRAATALAAVLVLGLSAGCASGNTSGRPTATVDEPLGDYPAAELIGVLDSSGGSVDDSPVYFLAEADDGSEIGLVLPHGFTSSEDGNEILDDSGNAVAVVGEQYAFAGGEYALSDEVWSEGPQVDYLWLTGTIAEQG
ncbi:hypothetical protein [Promicromonospora soli]